MFSARATFVAARAKTFPRAARVRGPQAVGNEPTPHHYPIPFGGVEGGAGWSAGKVTRGNSNLNDVEGLHEEGDLLRAEEVLVHLLQRRVELVDVDALLWAEPAPVAPHKFVPDKGRTKSGQRAAIQNTVGIERQLTASVDFFFL